MYETFRPKSNFGWAATSYILITLFAANSIIVVTSFFQTILELIFFGILGGLAYLIWIKPKLVLGEEGIKVVNPLKTEWISYTQVLELETKWVLTITHTEGQTRVWVAPATGKRRWIADKTFGWYGSAIPLTKSGVTDSESMSASLNSLSGQAAYMIRERIKRLH